ncbi:MAG: polyketide beta-ketoacyl:ACP synthase [Blastopirellula sp.]|nr:MAG: polyketide beta-ketoacyl:ACP synthase [Blastopirellula sp.]
MSQLATDTTTPIPITGLGITSAIGQGKDDFARALFEGKSRFEIMRRRGRQIDSDFIGAEIADFECATVKSNSRYRTASFSSQTAISTLAEAWSDAGLDRYDPKRIGLIVGGSNVQQRENMLLQDRYRENPMFVRPTYGFTFMDTDICASCTSVFDIKGIAFTVGGASASGQLAIIEAAEAIRSGRVDICIALGALMDISYWECRGLRSLGAMGSDNFANQPKLACRPFDKDTDGFIYGEACAAVVLESASVCQERGKSSYAHLSGWATHIDGSRTTAPSLEGEISVIKKALLMSGLTPKQIDYVNPHGTGSPIGDRTELEALATCGLDRAYINATKSITGHGLSAAGAVEVLSTCLQMNQSKLHPSLNMADPINTDFNWVGCESKDANLQHSLSLSMGFGGINTAVCLSKAA